MYAADASSETRRGGGAANEPPTITTRRRINKHAKRSSHYNAVYNLYAVRQSRLEAAIQYQGEKRLQLDPPECSRMAEAGCTTAVS